MKRIYALLIVVWGISHPASAQKPLQDSAFSCGLFLAHYSFQFPGGDLADRFGPNSNIGAGFGYKTSKNWMFALEGDYLFSDKIREDNILKNISTPDGWVIDANGVYADIYLWERGFSISGKAGKIIPVWGSNANSGLLLMAGGSFLQHKIRIENTGNSAPQVTGDYKKGYDRLTNGFGIQEFIGYQYLGTSRIYNFYLGLEFSQYWTQGQREFLFDTRTSGRDKRFDSLWGIRAAWVIPFRKRSSQVFYYY